MAYVPRYLATLVSAIVLVDTMFYAAITPLLPKLADDLDLGKNGAGVLTGAYAAGTLVGSLPAGWLIARTGVKATVLVGSSNGKTFNRVGVWFGPYVAGPYSEGAYELNFPVDKAVLETVKPAYRDAFSAAR